MVERVRCASHVGKARAVLPRKDTSRTAILPPELACVIVDDGAGSIWWSSGIQAAARPRVV